MSKLIDLGRVSEETKSINRPGAVKDFNGQTKTSCKIGGVVTPVYNPSKDGELVCD